VVFVWPLERVIRMNEKPRPGDWDELIACYRALRKAIAKNKPMKRKDRARISEHLRRLGWSEGAIGAATNELEGRWRNLVSVPRRGATWFQRQQGAIPAAEPSTVS
jgi:hypothetical protein